MNKNFIKNIVPALRMLISTEYLKTLKYIECTEIKNLNKLPDDNCLKLKIDENLPSENILSIINDEITNYLKTNKYFPFYVLINDDKIIIIASNAHQADIIKQYIFSNDINLIQDIKNINQYSSEEKKKVYNKIFIVTGGAQGFGEGIVKDLFANGANVVIADLNNIKGEQLAEQLNSGNQPNKALFCKTDVTKADQIELLVEKTVAQFGGIDVLISNAGILYAGDLDEMSPETFELITKVNYTGYFLCTKYVSQIMKTQSKYSDNYFMDIIQINSKSGLRGSNKNFAYAGGKFGGIGLTQSFALELIPYRIKVNSICPGNFFEGPLWSDPEKGLFVQYLRAGKVPGAKTIDDVKKYYEKQVPANRGCRVEDVMKAIYYAIDQEYETGQAIPVTGGQVMLN